jgi:putative transposase
MTRSKDSAKQLKVKEVLAEQEDFLRELIQQVVQQVLEEEMEEALGAEKGQRTPNRLGYRSGYYSRTLTTRVGKLELRVPQDRQGRFRTEVFQRYQRSEKALVGALAEMYRAGCFDQEGESDHRTAVRTRVFGLIDQPDQREPG